ncbi:MarR family winged helix-turn-helix transcriptional regulator [Paeniglutamicibacter cryotolerans]|uniref:DNA-binding MarR family transcriptional regulator n=1 Tax=Paeniglutamicibacter cryotolerans TaxID=670079 RepID=A0A839QEN4_9MICC|nr:MarR family transcriptional regulator [Paeniglutamicibacter cryotolerans]MBB2994609.1 DNA-binding MarR family transcriptional regulator [Paeniglutamicibacter cryotolerans]
MHPASALLRQILVLNASLEFEMRRAMRINETDFQALQHIIASRSMSPGELATRMHLTSAAVTTIIDRLERAGHVQRTAHPTDRRRRLVCITPQAMQEAMEHLMPMIMESDASVKNMEPEAQQAVVGYLRATTEAIERRIRKMRETDPSSAPTPDELG